MFFNEIYGKYYQAVAEILRIAVQNQLTEDKIYEISRNMAFSESILYIPESLKNGTWPFLHKDLSARITKVPEMPITLLEKKWLKTLLSDKRIRLFFPTAEEQSTYYAANSGTIPLSLEEELEGIEPIFSQEDIIYFDQYLDGDDYSDPEYIRNFHIILNAISNSQKIDLSFNGGRGKNHRWTCIPLWMEYSQKDDKFRLAVYYRHKQQYINMARISNVSAKVQFRRDELPNFSRNKEILVLELTDERKALERALVLFSYLKKETVKIAEKKYQIILHYDNDDATEILIRILSFGPMIKVISPESFKSLLKERIFRQRQILNKD